jgi:hypothetical protein
MAFRPTAIFMADAWRRLVEHYGRRGDRECALQYAWRQVELDPWQEGAHLQAMRLLALDGQRLLFHGGRGGHTWA